MREITADFRVFLHVLDVLHDEGKAEQKNDEEQS